jgi:hypothetical protein
MQAEMQMGKVATSDTVVAHILLARDFGIGVNWVGGTSGHGGA